jgi:alpha-amylase
MNWEAIKSILKLKKHCCIGKIRSIQKNHPSVGAGIHQQISTQPYTFPELFLKEIISDKVVVALDLKIGAKEISVGSIFANGTLLKMPTQEKKYLF